MEMNRFRICLFLCGLALLCRPAQAHDDQWIQVTSPHFTVSSNAGEKEARRIAQQCEEIRAVFQADFPDLRVDAGKPLVVIAVKNEDSLKVLLPDFWMAKDRVHPSGIFQPGTDEDFAVLRTDVTAREGENPYANLYEEYVFSLLRLNYSTMPLWLRLGMAAFYSNTLVGDNYTDVGRPTRAEIVLLQRSELIPFVDLMNADSRSPLYNDQSKAPLLYAESWAVVHYLTLNPEVAKEDLLNKYLKAWQETNDGAESARRTFGDLTEFEKKIDIYARQLGFYTQRRPSAARFSDKDYKARDMSPAEALVVQADFLQHTNHMTDARQMLKDALAMQPNQAALHDCLGYDDYVQHDNDGAEKEFQQAMTLDPNDYRSMFYLAEIIYRRSGYAADTLPMLLQYLETVVQINLNFAPAYAFLSVAYQHQPATKPKALEAAMKAHELEPARIAYVVDVGDALMALDRDADARKIGDRLNRDASTPQEKAMAESYAKRLAHYEEEALQKKSGGAGPEAAASGASPASQPPPSPPQPQN
jgi:predicted Zn-dependent protease